MRLGSGCAPAIEMPYERGSRCQSRRQISPMTILGAPERAPPRIVVEHTQTVVRRKKPLCRTFAEPSSGLEPETPSLPWNLSGNRCQPVASVFACFCGFRDSSIYRLLPPFATTGLHKGSIRSCCHKRLRQPPPTGPTGAGGGYEYNVLTFGMPLLCMPRRPAVCGPSRHRQQSPADHVIEVSRASTSRM